MTKYDLGFLIGMAAMSIAYSVAVVVDDPVFTSLFIPLTAVTSFIGRYLLRNKADA